MHDEPGFGTAEQSDVDRLFQLAEALHDKIGQLERRTEVLRLTAFPAVFVAIFLIWYGLGVRTDMLSLYLGAGAYVGMFGVVSYLFAQRVLRRADPDRRALGEVLAVLREVGDAYAETERWTPLQRVEFRIRLSRFGI